jgi:hypothetical protein
VVHDINTNYTVRRARMNSVTGESAPVNTDRPKPAVSHEVPGRVERPGPRDSSGGLGGGACPLWRGGVCERADSSTTTCDTRVARRATCSARRSLRARVRHSRALPRTPSAKETPRAWSGVPTRRRADRGASSVKKM